MKKFLLTIAVLFVYVFILAILNFVFEVKLPRIAAFIPLIITAIPTVFMPLFNTKK